jgi:DNA-binding transcriptional ArsR family regulator
MCDQQKELHMKIARKNVEHPAQLFGVLSDPTRLHVLMLLGKDEMSVMELTSATECQQPQVSKHLAILRMVGWVDFRRQGRTVIYSRTPAMSSFLVAQAKAAKV